MAIAKFSVVALDCPDPAALAQFYQAIVGGEIRGEGEWVQIELEGSADIAFQLAPNHVPPEWPDGSPQQAHLDLDVPDLDSAEAEILELGAVKAGFQPNPESFRVYLDPAGHPFCLVRAG